MELAAKYYVELLGTFTAEDTGIDYAQLRKTIYPPLPYTGMFLEQNLTPVEAWSHIRGDIVDAGSKAYCCPITN